VGIDRPDEDDAPDVEHDSPAAKGDAPAAEGDASAVEGDTPATAEPDVSIDSDAERRAYNVKYRETVAAEYRAVWDEAVPAFREAWAEHVRRYPHPERSQPTLQPDGSWVVDKNRKLSPEQNAEVDRGCTRIREVGENVIVPGMGSVESEDSSRELAGFQHRFKGEDRLKEKVIDRMRTKGHTPTEALERIPDAVRFTFQYSETAYTKGVQKDIERLEAHGFIQVERRNTWTDDQYKGINSRWREPESRVIFEVQFHTRASLEAKELTHKAYERIRTTAQDEERAELKEFQRRVNSMIPIPPDVADIEDYTLGDT
jgi:hypothetical protein